MKPFRPPTIALAFALALAVLDRAAAHGQTRAVPSDTPFAVVRLPSHGASATIIETSPGRTLLLGCAHAFAGADRRRPIYLDVPVATASPARPAVIRLLDLDEQADLSLILLQEGPLPCVAPVAPAGHRPGKHILSVGYDEMRWPAHTVEATILGMTATTTYTRERPGHGRSGGALLDADGGCLIGVVQGYEITGGRRGMYVSHATILRFLQRQGPAPQPGLREHFIPIPRGCPT